MYLRTYKRVNKNGTIAEYYQLAHNERDSETKQPVARIVHNFGRSNGGVRDELLRLCKSIARVCRFELTDFISNPEEKSENNSLPSKEKNRTLRQITDELQSSEEKFRMIFENARDMISFVDLDGKILDINPAVETLFGVTPEYAIGKHFSEIENLSEESIQEAFEAHKTLGEKDFPTRVEAKAYHKDGSLVLIEVTIRERKGRGPKGLICVIRDITERKLAETSLERHRDRLEELVKERTANLEEANTALRVLLRQKDEHKAELEENVLANVNEFILPNLEKLKTMKMHGRDQKVLDVVEKDLRDIISSFGQKLSSKYFNLTSTELRVANLIKYGHTTKEISELLYLSPRTVEFHRNNIRKKIGINKKQVNLKSFLLSLS